MCKYAKRHLSEYSAVLKPGTVPIESPVILSLVNDHLKRKANADALKPGCDKFKELCYYFINIGI